MTPLPKPFYVVEAAGKEFRVWLQDDTGYDIGITASKPITANARTSLTWARPSACAISPPVEARAPEGPRPSARSTSVAPAGPERDSGAGVGHRPGHDLTDHGSRLCRRLRPGRARREHGRTDVGAAYPGYGDTHGFDGTVAAPAGQHEVCAYGINVSGGGNQLIGCRTVNVTGRPRVRSTWPRRGPGRVGVAGWVSVPGDDGAQAVLSVDGVEAGRLDTNVARPDVAAAVPSAGSDRRLRRGPVGDGRFPPGVPQRRWGCASTALGCRTVRCPPGPPFGSLDIVSAGAGTVSVAGWAIDPDTAAPIQVHVYVGAAGTALSADQGRGDVGAVYPGLRIAARLLGDARAPVPARRQVCAYGINVGGGGNTLLGCRTVTVAGGQPFGAVDLIARTGAGIQVAGWAIDPDTAGSIPVHVYVGSSGYVLDADQPRRDVAGVFPATARTTGTAASSPIRAAARRCAPTRSTRRGRVGTGCSAVARCSGDGSDC